MGDEGVLTAVIHNHADGHRAIAEAVAEKAFLGAHAVDIERDRADFIEAAGVVDHQVARPGPRHQHLARDIQAVLDETGYLDMVRSDRSIEAMGREENLRELASAVAEFEEVGPASMGPADWAELDAMEQLDVDPFRRPSVHRAPRDIRRVVGRVVQDLDLELLAGVPDAAHVVDQPLHDVELVVDRQLDRDPGPDPRCGGPARPKVPCAIVEQQQIQPMASEESQDAENGVVREEYRVRRKISHC